MQGFPRSDIDIWQISTVRKDVVRKLYIIKYIFYPI